jgi:thioredoxin 1
MGFWKTLLLVGTIASSFSFARKPEEFLNSTLEQAYKDKSYVLLHFYAKWCFMCKAQKPILEDVMVNDSDLRKVVTLTIDYDNALKLREDFKRPSQSTLIILHGNQEVARSARLTQKEDVIAFLKKNIPQE